MTLPHPRTSALKQLAHSTADGVSHPCRPVHIARTRFVARCRGQSWRGECFVADRCRELALREGDSYGVAVMQSEHDGLVLDACVRTVLSHLAATASAGPLALARRAVWCVRTVLTVA